MDAADGEEGGDECLVTPTDEAGCMVDSHEKNGQQFDGTSVEDVPMAGELVALRRSGAEVAGKAGEGLTGGQ